MGHRRRGVAPDAHHWVWSPVWCRIPRPPVPRVNAMLGLASTMQVPRASCLSLPSWVPLNYERRLLRRDVDGAIRLPMCRRPAPGRRARWLEIQEARTDRSRRSASNGGEPLAAFSGSRCDRESHAKGTRQAKVRAGTEIAATRVPKGNPRAVRPRKPERAPEEARAGLLGRRVRPAVAEVGTRVPVAPMPCRDEPGGSDGACPKGREPNSLRNLSKMTEPSHKLTVDDAVNEFLSILRAQRGSDASAEWRPQTAEEHEAALFQCAEDVLQLLCPDRRSCPDALCRRLTLCRHLADLRVRRRDGRSPHPRRTPGAAALRHAIWLYMSACRT